MCTSRMVRHVCAWERRATLRKARERPGLAGRAQSSECLGACETAGSGRTESAGKAKSVTFLLTIPVLFLEPVLFTLRNLMGVHGARNVGAFSSSF